MGGVCSGGTKKRSVKVGEEKKSDDSSGFSGKLRTVQSIGKNKKENKRSLANNGNGDDFYKTVTQRHNHSGELLSSFSRELKSSTPARKEDAGKVNQKRSFLGKAGTAGLEKAVEVLDTLGSSMSNLNARSGFISGVAPRGNRISILAFEVANTITKGANLFQSLSEENVKFLKQEVLNSEGVRQLVSTDMTELLTIAAADKREELDVFSREVIRFGDLCKDPQWHNLGRYFSKSDSESSFDKQSRKEAEMIMQELTTLAQHTSELYHEFNALDRFAQDYQRKIEELESLNLPKKGEGLMILQSELKQQKKLVRSLKKNSLWSKSLEEIMEKLVDIVTYLQQAILEAFGNNGINQEPSKNPQRLGVAGLSLHYATMINQIDNIASRPASLPPNTRDNLYNALPPSVKTALRSRLQMVDAKEGLTVAQVKAEMEKTLQWLVPVAANTTKAHQGFGWVGEWANTGNEFGKSIPTNNNVIRLQTLYHANRQQTDQHILELVTWLHHLISLVRNRDHGLKVVPTRSPTRKGLAFHAKMQRTVSLDSGNKANKVQLSPEDRDMLDKVRRRRLVPGISKSQEFFVAKKSRKVWALSRSTGTSPEREISTRQKLNYSKANMLDVMDGLDFLP